MTDPEKIDVILRDRDMRTKADVILQKLYANEVIPFMDKYDDFVNAKSDKARGLAFAAIVENHLVKGCPLELNLEESQMDELRAFVPSPGPIASGSPLAAILAKAADQLKVSMVGTLRGQLQTSPQFESVQKLLAEAAQRPLPQTGSGRASLTSLKSFLTRRFTQSPIKDSTPSSSGSSSSSQANNAHRASAVRGGGDIGSKIIASAGAHDYLNMDAVLASPGATRDLRAYLVRGFEKMPGVNTENLDFLESYVDFAAEADPAAKKALLTAMVDKFVQQGSPSEINLMVGDLRKRVVEASRAWIAQGDAAMPPALAADLAKVRLQIEKLLQDKGNALDLLKKELFPQGDPSAT